MDRPTDLAFSARVSVLCYTHGEASTLHGVGGNLREIRKLELQAAAEALGVCDVKLAPYPDGGLGNVGFEELVAVARDAAALRRAEGLLAFDSSGVTGHPDHIRATEVAIKVGESERLGVLGWTLPAAVANVLQDEYGALFIGHPESEIDVELVVSRIGRGTHGEDLEQTLVFAAVGDLNIDLLDAIAGDRDNDAITLLSALDQAIQILQALAHQGLGVAEMAEDEFQLLGERLGRLRPALRVLGEEPGQDGRQLIGNFGGQPA